MTHMLASLWSFLKDHFEEITAGTTAFAMSVAIELSTFIGIPAATFISAQGMFVEQSIRSGFIVFNTVVAATIGFFIKRFLEKRFKK